MNEPVLSKNHADNVRLLDQALRVDDSFDLIKREMNVNGYNVVMYYIDGFVKAEMMQKLMLYFVTVKDWGDTSDGSAAKFAEKSVPSVEVDLQNGVNAIVTSVLSGCTAMLCDGFDANAVVIDARTYPARSTEEPENDRVMRGSRDGFVETLIFNTALLRRRIRDPNMTVKYKCIGSSSRTDVAMCYIEGKADPGYVKYLSDKLDAIKTSSLTMGHRSLSETLIRRRWYNPFPKIRATERPDTAAACVLEGSIVIICDNSPEVMIFPTTIFDFLQETDDYYFPPLTGTYLRLVRHAIFWLTIIVTPVWYMLLMNKDWLTEPLKFLIPADPGMIPILLQLYLVELAIDGLKLASMNTPSMLSNSLSVVGGLLLGDFAIKVGWLCPDVILFMSFVAIANFTQSSYELGYAFKYMRLILLTATAIFNYWGFIGAFILIIVLVATNKTVNGKRNYLYPLIPFNPKAMMRLFFRVKKHD